MNIVRNQAITRRRAGIYTANLLIRSLLESKNPEEILLLLNSLYKSSSPFTKEQMEALQQIFKSQVTANAATTQDSLGAGHFALHVANQHPSSSCIVDSGAFDHMTCDRKLFTKFVPYYGSQTVRIANGSRS